MDKSKEDIRAMANGGDDCITQDGCAGQHTGCVGCCRINARFEELIDLCTESEDED